MTAASVIEVTAPKNERRWNMKRQIVIVQTGTTLLLQNNATLPTHSVLCHPYVKNQDSHIGGWL